LSWLKAGLGTGLASNFAVAAVVAFRFDCPTFRCEDFVACGERAAAGEVVEKGCAMDGRLRDRDRRALEPGRNASLVAMLSVCVEGGGGISSVTSRTSSELPYESK